MESILDSMKKLLGMDASYTVFDVDLVIHINSIFATLAQLGVGAPEGFFIQGSGEEWHTFTSDNVLINNVKSYMYLKLRLMFDPLIYCASRLCAIPNRRAMAEALISGCAINRSYNVFSFLERKNPSKLKSSSSSAQ